jgi:hypothetical protein
MKFEFHSNNYRNFPATNEKFVLKVNHKCIFMFHIGDCGKLIVTVMVKERKFEAISDNLQSDILYMNTKLN